MSNYKFGIILVFLSILFSGCAQEERTSFEVFDLAKVKLKKIKLDKYFFTEDLFKEGYVTVEENVIYNKEREYKFFEYTLDCVNVDDYLGVYYDIEFEDMSLMTDDKNEMVFLLAAIKTGFATEEIVAFTNKLSEKSSDKVNVAQEKYGLRYLIKDGDRVTNIFFVGFKTVDIDFNNNLNTFYSLGYTVDESKIRERMAQLSEEEKKELKCIVYITDEKYDKIFCTSYVPSSIMKYYSYSRGYYQDNK